MRRQIAFIEENSIQQGSAYKYLEMFKQIEDVDIHIMPLVELIFGSRHNPSGAIIMGDRVDTYQALIHNKIPYILIENDVHSLRSGQVIPEEQEMIEHANGVLFPAKVMYDHCRRRYNLPHSEIIQLRPLKKDLEFEPLLKMPKNHVVYCGNYLSKEFELTPWGHRYLVPLFTKIREAGYVVHLYPSVDRSSVNREYRMIGCITHDIVPNGQLYQRLSQYSVGLQLFQNTFSPAPINYARTVEPNKIWEYLGAGIPTLGIYTGYSATFYDGKWGYNIENPNPSVEEIQETMKKVQQLQITDELRFSQVMDNDIEKFKNLIASL